MNKEKELLLALLIEKYATAPKVEIYPPSVKKKRVHRRAVRHNPTNAVVWGKVWSSGEHEFMKIKREEGMSFKDIADLLGRSPGAVEIRCRQTVMSS